MNNPLQHIFDREYRELLIKKHNEMAAKRWAVEMAERERERQERNAYLEALTRHYSGKVVR